MFCPMCCVCALLAFMCVHVGVYVSVQRSESHGTSAHLKALGADFLAFFHPGDSGFGFPGGLTHKRRNSTRDARLVFWGFDESWQSWGSQSKGGRGRWKVIKRGRGKSQGGRQGRSRAEGMERNDVSAFSQLSACETWLSMGITFSAQRQQWQNPQWHCFSAHLQLRHFSYDGHIFVCLPVTAIMLNFSLLLWHTIWNSSQTIKVQFHLLKMRDCIKPNW